MGKGQNSFLTGVSYELGELEDISSLQALERNPVLLQTFRRLGLDKYGRSSKTPSSLATTSARKTLALTGLRGDEIDLLVYGTSSFWDRTFAERGVSELLNSCELKRAFPIGVFATECTNVASVLGIAREFLKSGRYHNIMAVFADRFSDDDPRIIPPELSVASDAAASCLVTSNQPPAGFKFRDWLVCAQPSMFTLDLTQNPAEYIKQSGEAIRDMIEQLYSGTGLGPDDFAQLITSNFNLSTARSLSLLSRVPMEKIYVKNIVRFGHAYSDLLINLADYYEATTLKRKSLIHLLATGPFAFGSVVLETI
jgi:3-oxoacyl-[acyl-carrier-protein] synthase III